MANYNPPVNAFKPGNKSYKKADHTGRIKRFATPDHLWQAACRYFEYCSTSPIPSLTFRRGKLTTIYKMRPMSAGDLFLHLGVTHLDYYKKMADYAPILIRIRYVIYEYNYTGAAAGLLKGRIVSRTIRKKKKVLRVETPEKNNFILVHPKKVRILSVRQRHPAQIRSAGKKCPIGESKTGLLGEPGRGKKDFILIHPKKDGIFYINTS